MCCSKEGMPCCWWAFGCQPATIQVCSEYSSHRPAGAGGARQQAVKDSDCLLAIVDASHKPEQALAMIQPGDDWRGPPMAVVRCQLQSRTATPAAGAGAAAGACVRGW